ncbi:MAG: hypothetical protein ACN6OP_27360, partial [Pseudomonadales bacterium]
SVEAGIIAGKSVTANLDLQILMELSNEALSAQAWARWVARKVNAAGGLRKRRLRLSPQRVAERCQLV